MASPPQEAGPSTGVSEVAEPSPSRQPSPQQPEVLFNPNILSAQAANPALIQRATRSRIHPGINGIGPSGGKRDGLSIADSVRRDWSRSPSPSEEALREDRTSTWLDEQTSRDGPPFLPAPRK